MRSCEFQRIFVAIYLLFALAATTEDVEPITTVSKVELTPVHIECRLTDMVVLTAPIINNKAMYYLSNPRGYVKPLNVSLPLNKTHTRPELKEIKAYDIVLNWIDLMEKGYLVFNVNSKKDGVNFDDIHCLMKANDILIGPVNADDHGNWVLSLYTKDLNEEWIEFFQVITIEIIEYVPPNQNVASLRSGETFLPSFAFPIESLESCELVIPNSNSDRYYGKDPTKSEWCGFIVNSVTKRDKGNWSVIGVGKIVYMTRIYLEVDGNT